MLPPALAPATFSNLPCVVILSGDTSMILNVREHWEAVIKSIVIVNGGPNAVTVSGYVGIGGREGYLTPKQISLEAAGSSSSWMVMDNEMRLQEGDWIRAMASEAEAVTMMIFGDNVFVR